MFKDLKKSYIIAEIGVNHEGSIDTALKQVELAKKAGASAVKFQAYKANKLAAKESPYYWDLDSEPTESQYELFKKYDSFDQADYEKLALYCQDLNIDFSSTPFDTECLSWIVKLMPFIKIASADLTNDILLEAVSEYKKPIILSLGASAFDEVDRALEILSNGSDEIVLMHCVLNYPTKPQNAFLHRINVLQERYGQKYTIGYSDHISPASAGDDQILISRGLGVKIFEKHFTHDKNLPGNDHYHSMDQTDLARLRNRLDLADSMINESYSESEFLRSQESAIKNARRSLYYSRDIDEGSIIQKDDFIPKRPGTGLEVKFYSSLVGKKLKVDVKSDDIVDLSHYQPI
jgi:sialic acid synthase SpsE